MSIWETVTVGETTAEATAYNPTSWAEAVNQRVRGGTDKQAAARRKLPRLK